MSNQNYIIDILELKESCIKPKEKQIEKKEFRFII